MVEEVKKRFASLVLKVLFYNHSTFPLNMLQVFSCIQGGILNYFHIWPMASGFGGVRGRERVFVILFSFSYK